MEVFPGSFSPSFQTESACSQVQNAILSALPDQYSNINAVLIKDNLAVIPGDWTSGDLTSPFYDITPTDNPCLSEILSHIKTTDFIAYSPSFLDKIGPTATLERIQSFPPSHQNVHEAPIYLPETNELLYSDTGLTGTLYALSLSPPHTFRNITSNPPLHNVNGGTSHDGKVYLATNGGPTRGIFTLNLTTGETQPIVNNFRGRRFNSPNDLIFDSIGNMYFTDPPYGKLQGWPGVQEPELPNSIYRFDPLTGALTTLATSTTIGTPNGLALSADEKTLYVADSSSTSMEPASHRAVYAFDIRQPGGLLDGPRLVYQIESGWPDGLRVTKSGLLVISVAGGADFVDPDTGLLLGRINAPDDWIFNVEPARGKGAWLLTGKNHIYKATIREGAVESWIAGNPPVIHNNFVKPLQGLWSAVKG